MHDGENLSVPEIYKRSRKRWGCSKYLLSVEVIVAKDGNKNKGSHRLDIYLTCASLY